MSNAGSDAIAAVSVQILKISSPTIIDALETSCASGEGADNRVHRVSPKKGYRVLSETTTCCFIGMVSGLWTRESMRVRSQLIKAIPIGALTASKLGVLTVKRFLSRLPWIARDR